MQKKTRYILFVILILALWIPLLQEQFGWFNELTLKGAYIKPYKPLMSLDSVKDLTYQQQFEKFKNFNFGLRAFTIKLKNSVNYLLFKELSITDNVAGKEGMIFSRGSIERTYGKQYNGKNKNELTISRIAFLKEGIENTGGHFLVVTAPSKEFVYPDYLPSEYSDTASTQNDYRDMMNGYRKNQIPVLDFCSYLKAQRPVCNYPIFTKTGFHWSLYCASFIEDTLLSYIQAKLGKSIPSYKRVGIIQSDTAIDPDADFEIPLNLLFSIGEKSYMYPKLEMVKTSEKNYRPKVIIIGDSFFWQLKHQKMLMHIFSEDSKFWYYFARSSFPMGDVPGVPLQNLNILSELQTADFVILLGNQGNSWCFPYGLADYYYEHAAPGEIHWAICEHVRSIPALNNGTTDQNSVNEISKRICRDGKRVSIIASNGKYICAGGANEEILIANRDAASDWERFVIYKLENKFVAISSYKNNFLTAELGRKGEVTSTRNKIGDWEKFELVPADDNLFAFKAANGKYLSLTGSGQIFATSNSIGKNEKFKLVIK